MSEPKVDAETAMSEVLRICEAYHVDTDVEHMGTDEAAAFRSNCETAKKAVMRGDMELGDDGLAVFRSAGKSLVFQKPTGATFLSMDRFDKALSRVNAAAEQMTSSNPGTLAKLPARDWQTVMSLVNLFL